MAKALHGTVASASQLRLLDEIRALRQRVSELEAALDDARSANRADSFTVVNEERAVAAV